MESSRRFSEKNLLKILTRYRLWGCWPFHVRFVKSIPWSRTELRNSPYVVKEKKNHFASSTKNSSWGTTECTAHTSAIRQTNSEIGAFRSKITLIFYSLQNLFPRKHWIDWQQNLQLIDILHNIITIIHFNPSAFWVDGRFCSWIIINSDLMHEYWDNYLCILNETN